MLGRTFHCRMRRALWVAIAAWMVVLVAQPQIALADFSIDEVVIDATVASDGSVAVQEARTFDFDGSYHGVYWNIPTGSYESRQIKTTVTSVGEMVGGSYVPFEEGYEGIDHTYQLRDEGNIIQVKLYSAHEDEDATFVINYTDTNLAARYDDVSMLYWKFVSDGWDVESQNVTCTVHLPVPEGKKVEPEENVRAWGHGPLDAVVSFEGNDVVYTVPGVGSSEYAEARITFPDEWLSQVTSQGGSVLQQVLAEERQWADEANDRRARARAIAYGGSAISVLATLATVVGSLFSLVRYRRTHKPQFDDKYYRDVPSDDHPAVLGALYRGGKPEGEDFTATLMRLTDMGAMRIELVTLKSKGLFGRTKSRQDYRLTCPPETADRPLDEIDRRALRTLFVTIGRVARKHDGDDPAIDTLYFSDVEDVAKRQPQRFQDGYDAWVGRVQKVVASRKFFKGTKKTGRALAVTCASVAGVLTVPTILFAAVTELYGLFALVAVQLISVGLGIFVAICCKNVSDEAIELKAKLVALRRWLKDFTRLGEAVPRDVVLWNHLLVMAVVLGVADEVIEQLKMTMPEILEDPYLSSTYYWYRTGPSGTPYQAFSNTYSEAHSVSTAKLAESSSSSGGGGGGGFSGGGGGGFGGGGGGGAF